MVVVVVVILVYLAVTWREAVRQRRGDEAFALCQRAIPYSYMTPVDSYEECRNAYLKCISGLTWVVVPNGGSVPPI